MSLSTYNKKRSFDDTPEPAGKKATAAEARKTKAAAKKIFVIQRHDASHLHYDFRLEADGVLKSWAVPKGPSLNLKDKRLAVQVEDHPKSYATFKGDIPEGNYGAGHVDIWDHGTYHGVDEDGNLISESEFLAKLEEGHLKFQMKGRKLKGLFKLVRMKDGKNWLLMKGDDEHATEKAFDIEAGIKKVTKKPTAAKKKTPPVKLLKSTVKNIRAGADDKYSEYIHPMLAKLHDAPFDDDDWLFEIKWDGYRAIAECNKKKPRLYSRNGLSFEARYEAIFDALKALEIDAVLDGEVVAVNEDGKSDFQALQGAHESGVDLHYYVFDLLELNGKNVKELPLTDRKELLEKLLPKKHDLIHYSDHVVGQGQDFFKVMQQRGLEGMIAKRAGSKYHEGSRSADWLKIKHVLTDEAIICGYTEPRGSRRYFGALILGRYDADEVLQYIGHTGTGFGQALLKELHGQMQPLERKSSPFEEKIHVNAPVHWLKPQLVCNIKFTEVTKDGSLRHPVYIGLRDDKAAKEVNGADAAEKPTSTKKKAMPENGEENSIKAGTHKVNITNPDKVFWPDEGYTKGDLIAYYEGISKWILPHLKGRPLSLLRNPNGIKEHGFFHKNAGENAPDYVQTERVWSDSSDRNIEYIVCNNKATLLYLANMGCIEMNPWHSKVGALERPDYLVIDLDPSDGNTFEQVIETAKAVKQVLDEAGAAAYCKTSGSTGLHICVPLKAKYDYDQAVAFAEIIAVKAQELVPDFTSLERSLKKRGGNIYIDYLQNRGGQTIASAYSVRPKPGATVSAPLHWAEVKKGLTMEKFNIKNMLKRVEKEGDIFAAVLGRGINLASCLKKLGA